MVRKQSLFLAAAAMVLAVILSSCGSDSEGPVGSKPGEGLAVTNVVPRKGAFGDTVYVMVRGFKAKTSKIELTFGDVKMPIVQATAEQLTTIVPKEIQTGPVKITVTIGSQTITGGMFKVISPKVFSITPGVAAVGDTVSIKGRGFSSTPSWNKVTFGGVEAPLVSATNTQLTVTVPKGATSGEITEPKKVPVEVQVGDKTAARSDDGMFTIMPTYESLTIRSFSASSKGNDFKLVKPVAFKWSIANPKGGTLTCKLDIDGDGGSDYSIEPCAKRGSQLWLYRKHMQQTRHAPPALTVSNGTSTVTQTLTHDISVESKRLRPVISAKYRRGMALTADGSVMVWGAGVPRQDKTGKDLENVRLFAAGSGMSAFIKEDGTFVAYGRNSGEPFVTSATFPEAIDVGAGSGYVLVVKGNGRLFYSGNSTTEPPHEAENIIAVSAGRSHATALKEDGTVIAWGNNSHGQTEVPAGLIQVVAIESNDAYFWNAGNPKVGPGFSLALKADGTVVAWGANIDGQTEVPKELDHVVAIAAGGHFALALKADGTVVAWGDNAKVPTDLDNVIGITAGRSFSLALKANGEVVKWGPDNAGTPPKGIDLTP